MRARFDFVPDFSRKSPNPETVAVLREFLQDSGLVAQRGLKRPKICVVTGAGISTESGIPDYRSPGKGSYSRGHKPLTHQEFVQSEALRKRYWARAVVASRYFEEARPNAGHFALAQLEKLGIVSGLVTQNVDRLHIRAGSENVLELHGHTDSVACLSCSAEYSRPEYHRKLFSQNKDWFHLHMPSSNDLDIRADGDADIATHDFHEFLVPGCSLCHGTLMPTIVFFGGTVPAHVREKSFDMVRQADKLLVLGSSLAVYSSFRLCKAANEQGKPIAIVNAGETRADKLATLKIEDHTLGPLLQAVLGQLEDMEENLSELKTGGLH